MPKEIQNIDITEIDSHHSEEAEEVLGSIPGWIVRWGITLFFILFIGIIIGCYFIKFPQIIKAPIIITTENPPARLFAGATGRIDSVFVLDGSKITSNTTVAILDNTADYTEILTIIDSLSNETHFDGKKLAFSKWIDVEYSLGELQSAYQEFKSVCFDYRRYLAAANIEQKQFFLNEQIAKTREFYNIQSSQKELLLRNLDPNSNNISQDLDVSLSGLTLTMENTQIQQKSLHNQLSMENLEAGLIITELNLLQKEQQLMELSIQRDIQVAAYERELNSARQKLLNHLEQWRSKYVISSPINGNIRFSCFPCTDKVIQAGEQIAVVIPEDSAGIIGIMTVPTKGFGKVAVGQVVNIKLNSYPHMEYGMIKGVVTSIGDVLHMSDGHIGYMVKVALPSPLTTTYHHKLNLIYEMDGTGEIITKDERLIMRFIQPIIALFDK